MTTLRARRRLRALLLAGLAAGALVLAWVGHDATTSGGASRDGLPHARQAAADVQQQVPQRAAAPVVPAPVLHDFAAREAFRERLDAFLAAAPRMDAQSRARALRRLEDDVTRYEAARELSAGEAVLLRTALIRAGVDDPARQADRLAEMSEAYRERAQRRMREHATRPPPQLVAYHERERAIVAEVASLRSIPGGIDRDEYLRRRLQAEREALYDAP